MPKYKILIADDSPDLRTLMTIRLETSGFAVIGASNGEEAITKAKEQTPDLIFLDITMPKKDGLTACKELRQDQKFRKTPIFIVTARRETGDTLKAIVDCGATAFFIKPYGPQQLLDTIKKHLPDSQEK